VTITRQRLPWGRQRMRLAFLSALLCALFACEGSHNDLGADTTSASTGGGAAGGGGSGGGGSPAQGGAPAVVEPDGPARLTVIHGIVDRPSLQLCFAASPSDAGDEAEPWPPSPLDFASAEVISELPGAPLPASSSSVEILVLTGDLAAASGATCREIADDPGAFEGLEVLSLGVTPVASLTSPRSFALVVSGCFGGEGHDDVSAELLCGSGYTSLSPTPSIVLAPLSRVTAPTAIGLQILNATAGGASIDGQLQPSFDGVPFVPLASLVVPGQAAPFPPNTSVSAAELGIASEALVRLGSASSIAGVELDLGDAMAAGGIDGADLANGENVALVAVGAAPGAPALAWSNGLALVAVDADPVR
jgi:hypothetical protein